MKTILYIEDDKEIGEWLSKDLKDRGFKVIWEKSGSRLNDYIFDADLLIVDIMLPGLDGFTIGKLAKKSRPDLPILVLSARTSIEDKLLGLEFADDYVTKPFHPEELAARIEVLFRRLNAQRPLKIEFDHIIIYPEDNLLVNPQTKEEIRLTGKQYQILHFFLKYPNQILTKEQIFEGVWGEAFLEGDKTLMVHIRYLREKIEKDPANPIILETIRGLGYRFKL